MLRVLDLTINFCFVFPHTAPPNITCHSASRWQGGEEHTEANCSVESVAPAAAITWHVGKNKISSHSSASVQEDLGDGRVLVRSSVHLLSSLYSGQNLTCIVEHPSLRAPEKRTTRVPEQSVFLSTFSFFSCIPHANTKLDQQPFCLLPEARLLSVHVVREENSPFWLAVCECAGTDLTWLLPDSARDQTSMHSESEGHVLKSRLTYRFSLALHEGQNLTCVHDGRGTREERTVQVPRYRK